MAPTSNALVAAIPLLPLAGALVNGLFGRRLPRRSISLVACATVLASFILAIVAVHALVEGGDTKLTATLYGWMHTGSLALDVAFTMDRLSAVMVLVITGVGFLIHVYSIGYMSHEPSLARYFAYLNLFTFAMLVLVLGDSLPLLFVGWEGVGLCSYLLIGFWYTDSDKAAAGKKAFIVNRIGDAGFIVAMLLLFRTAGTLRFDGLADAVTTGSISTAVATAACLLLLLGATGKSAQIPLFVWLPDAMAGPTPVSALIHAATMVTAGVYLTARLGFLFTLAPAAMLAVAIVGALTALFAASIGTAQNDIKKVLAYSTVSQLGFMFLAAGVGAFAAAIAHLVTHAFFKACLFLGAGSVIHALGGEQDLRHMGGLRRRLPVTFWTFAIATAAITGLVPGLSGFITKDAILAYALNAGHAGADASAAGQAIAATFAPFSILLWLTALAAAVFTSFYMWRLVFLAFFSGETRAAAEVKEHVHESPASMLFALLLLAALSAVGGAIAWPHLLGGHDALAGFLAPVIGRAPAPEGSTAAGIVLMLVSLIAAGGGFAWAYVLYAKQVHPLTNRFASERPWRFIFARVAGRWHIDELYDAMVVRPLAWVSKVVLFEGIEKRVIDATVNLTASLARTVGFLGQLFQSGNVQRYIAVFAIALAMLIYGWLLPATPPPSHEQAAQEMGAPHEPSEPSPLVEQ